MPILFSIGPVRIYSFGVLLAVGLFIALYFWWKMGRDEHLDEIALFDGFFLSLITFLVAGRAGYVLMHYSELGTLYRSLAILAFPGVSGLAGIVASVGLMIMFARERGWLVWKVMDMFSVALAVALVFGSIGALLNGSNPAWQVNAWSIAWSVVTFATVSRVRKDFRFYAWYKGVASMAQEGLAGLIFVLLSGVYYLGMQQLVLGGLLVVVSTFVIYKRVGRRDEGMWGKLVGMIRRK